MIHKIIIFSFVFMTCNVFAKDNLCLTDFKEKISESQVNKLLDLRPKAIKHCLICGSNSCTLKKWDEANKKNESVCKRLFCKPTETNRNVFASSEGHGFGKTSVLFTYSISKEGRVQKVNLLQSKGKMKPKRALIFLKDNLRMLKFEPLIIEGKFYSINELQGSTSWNIVEK